MQGRRRVEIRSQKRLFDDFFKIDEYHVSYQLYEDPTDPKTTNKMSGYIRRLNFERGDAVGVLLFNVDTRSVVLVEQFKLPSLIGRRRDDPAIQDGWIVEVMAGMIGATETAEDAAIRETMEETGYEIEAPKLICKFLSSPGGTSERIFLYFATVTDSKRPGKDKIGVGDENIRVLERSVNDLFLQLEKGEIDDPKLAIAAYWLKDNMRLVEDLQPGVVKYEVAGKPGLIIGYKTGSIDYVKDVRAWVNSENTDMMMDRFIGRSISARIRYLGANKQDDNIVEDTIQESLRGVIGEHAHVKIGTVLVTEPGMLRSSHKVQLVFHVAAVEGGIGGGMKANPDVLKNCVEKVLERVDRENNKLMRIMRKKFIDSILFPMMGAGDGGVPIEDVAEKTIPAAIDYLRTTPNPKLKEIYFLAFQLREKSACDKVLEEYREKGVLTRLGNG